MLFKKLKLSVVLLISLGITGLKAQEVILPAGGNASGSGGSSVSYSIGQIVYTTHTGTNGSEAQGVQQPYEISVVIGIPEANGINLSVTAYPNPTSDYLTLEVGNYDSANLQYLIFDVSGKLLQTIDAQGPTTQIEIRALAPGNYFVKVLDNKEEIKVFKIIKTS